MLCLIACLLHIYSVFKLFIGDSTQDESGKSISDEDEYDDEEDEDALEAEVRFVYHVHYPQVIFMQTMPASSMLATRIQLSIALYMISLLKYVYSTHPFS